MNQCSECPNLKRGNASFVIFTPRILVLLDDTKKRVFTHQVSGSSLEGASYANQPQGAKEYVELQSRIEKV